MPRRALAVLALALSTLACAHARYKPKGRPVPYQGYFATFPSGMRLVVYEMPHVNRFAVTVSYGSGSVEDPAGKEGLAHLAEHLAFRAAPSWGGSGRIWDRLVAAGFRFNATTSLDETEFFEVGKPADLRNALALEAARMRDPLARVTQDDFAIERDVVVSEYRERFETSSERSQLQWALEQAFPDHPYGRSVAGTPESIRAISLEDVRAWVKQRYVPANAVVVVIAPRAARETARLVADVFGELAEGDRSRHEPRAPTPPPLPKPDSERPLVTRAAPVPQPVVWVAWPVPGTHARLAPQAAATAAALRVAVVGKLWQTYRSGGLQVFEDISTGFLQFAGGGLVFARVELVRGDDAAKVADAVKSAAFDLRLDDALSRYDFSSRVLSAYGRSEIVRRVRDELLVDGYLALEDVNGAKVASFLRATGVPDYLDGWQKMVALQLRYDVSTYVSEFLRRERSVSVLVLPDRNARARDLVARVARPAGDPQEGAGDDALPPPEPDAVLSAAGVSGLGAAERRVLGNGLTAIVVERGALPIAEVRVVVRTSAAGTAEIPAGLPELALGSNVPSFYGWDLALVGGAGWTKLDDEHLVRTNRGSSANLDVLLQSTAEWVRDQRVRYFDEVKDAYVRRVARAEADPLFAASAALNGGLFPGHPYGAAPSAKTLEGVGSGAASSWLGGEIRPERATLVVVSDQPASADLWAAIEQEFGGWRRGSTPRREAPPPAPPTSRRVVLVDRPGASQALLAVGLRGPPRAASDEAASEAVRWLVGDRLNRKIRIEEGVSYGVAVSALEREAATALVSVAAVDRDAAARSLATMLGAPRALAEAGPDPASAARARWQVARRFAFAFDTVSESADALEAQASLGLAPDHFDRQPPSIAALTPERIRAAAASLAIGREAIVVMGDASVLRPQLEAAGFAPELVARR